MVPIHDTDLAHERWAQAEWQHYELWEKVEIKLRQRRGLWIAVTAVIFLLLSSIPILIEHSPKWNSLRAARALGEQINLMKRDAGMENQAYRLEFPANHELSYTIYKVASCAEPPGTGTVARTGTLVSARKLGGYRLVAPELGRKLGIPGLVDSICYDPLLGSVITPSADSIEGFAIIPAQDLPDKDLTDARQDRMSIVIFKGPAAEVSFE